MSLSCLSLSVLFSRLINLLSLAELALASSQFTACHNTYRGGTSLIGKRRRKRSVFANVFATYELVLSVVNGHGKYVTPDYGTCPDRNPCYALTHLGSSLRSPPPQTGREKRGGRSQANKSLRESHVVNVAIEGCHYSPATSFLALLPFVSAALLS